MSEKQPRGIVVTLFGVVGTACFAFLALEYVMARYDTLSDFVNLPDPYGLDGFFNAIPIWSGAAITAAIWLGLLGSVLLLLRDKAAVLVLSLTFLASLVALVWGVLQIVAGQGAIGSVLPLEFAASLALVGLGLWLYARTAKRGGAL